MKHAILRSDESSEYYFEERCFITELSNSEADDALSIARARVEAGVTTVLHRVRETVERYVILDGEGEVEIGGQSWQRVAAQDVVVIPAGVTIPRRALRVTGVISLYRSAPSTLHVFRFAGSVARAAPTADCLDRGWVRYIAAPLIACCVLAACATQHEAVSAVVFDGLSAGELATLVADGRSEVLHCNSCHALSADAPPPFGDDQGPHLEAIVGRPAAAVEGFAYTEVLRQADIVWDIPTLDRWLENPDAPVVGLCRPFAGISDAQQRLALIAYLAFPARR